MKVSSKHSESVYCDFGTIEGIKIMVILIIELSPKYQMQDWIYYLEISKICRIYNLKSTKQEI